ncbi:hypothetical protein P43SY_009689 [Pythium insidiosum]|uniref:Transmembrane protein n=1 Tax=Pythium insidiosum TaxID=114742 RepID=A0AAD5LFJ7_PYTIN|nr:hypothetical protein P43SY_009689 [Pythium insidiosum]
MWASSADSGPLQLHSATRLHVLVTRRVYRVLWLTVLTVHLVCTVYPWLIGFLYLILPGTAPGVLDLVYVYQLAVPQERFRLVAAGVTATARAVISATDVTNRHFDAFNLVREIIETGILSWQAYVWSYRVGQGWMNNALIALLVLNCWSTPMARLVTGSAVGRTRLLCLVINLLLDVTMYIVVPVTLVVPYLNELDSSIHDFDPELTYTDRWLVRMLNEWPILFISSNTDGIFSFFIAQSIVLATWSIPRLFSVSVNADKTQSFGPVIAEPVSLLPRDQGPTRSASGLSLQRPRAAISLLNTSIRFGHHLLMLWGLVVLAVHLHAASHGTNPQ